MRDKYDGMVRAAHDANPIGCRHSGERRSGTLGKPVSNLTITPNPIQRGSVKLSLAALPSEWIDASNSILSKEALP